MPVCDWTSEAIDMSSRFAGLRWSLPVCALVVCAGCQVTNAPSRVQADGERGIRDLVASTMDAVVSRDMKQYLRYFDPQGAHVLPNRPIDYGVADRKGGFPPGYAVTMRIEKVEVSRSGELGYAFGDYNQTRQDPQTGALNHYTGKWMSVFRKQPDGSWGAIADTYNVDTATP
jgi:ketosteroid isomerase-like protein